MYSEADMLRIAKYRNFDRPCLHAWIAFNECLSLRERLLEESVPIGFFMAAARGNVSLLGHVCNLFLESIPAFSNLGERMLCGCVHPIVEDDANYRALGYSRIFQLDSLGATNDRQFRNRLLSSRQMFGYTNNILGTVSRARRDDSSS